MCATAKSAFPHPHPSCARAPRARPRQEACRRTSLRAIADVAAAASGGADAVPLQLQPGAARLDPGGGHTARVRVRNEGAAAAAFAICGPPPAGALPSWLDASPVCGVIPGGGCVEVSLQAHPVSARRGPLGPQAAQLAVTAAPQGAPAAAAWPVGGAMAGYGGAPLAVQMQ